ncbi:MAG: MMPL family transporter [Deltaproteobacteria bacterium]|nr:MMPL family transporter [Deltaproteobacteria bacterium]
MSVKGRWVHLIQARPKKTLLVLLALLICSLALLSKLKIETGMGVFHNKDDARWMEMKAIDARFVNDDLLVIAFETDQLFSYKRLTTLRKLGEEILRTKVERRAGKMLPAFEDITSLATVDDLQGSEFSFRNMPLVPTPIPRDEALLARIGHRARNNPLIRTNLLSPAHHGDAEPHVDNISVLYARFHPHLDDAAHGAAITQVRALLASAAEGTPTRYHLAGQPVADADTATYQSADLARFIPVVYALMIVLLYVFLRRAMGTLIAVAMIFCNVTGAIALLVLLGGSINNCSAMLPPVVITLATALLLHYFSELGKNHGAGAEKAALVRRTVGELLAPVLMGAITTGIGFASLSVSEIPAVREFGVTAGLSMLLTFVMTTLIFVLAASRLGPEKLVAGRGIVLSRRFHGLLTGLAEFVIRRRRAIVVSGLLFGGVAAAGFGRIVVDMDPVAIFPADAPVRRATSFIDEHLDGSTVIVVAIRGPAPQHFATPKGLHQLQALESFMRAELGVKQVTSVVDFVRLMHREFFNGDAKHWTIPPAKEQIAQLLLLNTDRSIDEVIDGQRQWTRLVARMPNTTTMALKARYDVLESYLAQHFLPEHGFETHATGRARMNAEISNKILESLSSSLLVSGTLITLLFFLLFRSLSTGLTALPANLLPIASIFGLMGWVGIRLDAATVMTTTVALGIAVDDTIHFLQQMRLELARHGDRERAVRETIRIKGPAIIWTSLVISVGFSVLLLSQFAPTRNFGILISFAMITALAGDLLFLPALLLCTKTSLGVR